MNETPAAAPSAPPKRRRRVPNKLIALGVVVALAGGGWWYVNAPDLPPGGPLAGLDIGRALSGLPIVGSGGKAPAATLEETAASKAAAQAVLEAQRKMPVAVRETQLRQQLSATGFRSVR